jgi:hypothetical protein
LIIPQGPVVVRRRASQRGQIQVAGERVQVGLSHARQVVTVHVSERELRIFDQGGLIKVIPRRHHQTLGGLVLLFTSRRPRPNTASVI